HHSLLASPHTPPLRALLSFPTRRSSDLATGPMASRHSAPRHRLRAEDAAQCPDPHQLLHGPVHQADPPPTLRRDRHDLPLRMAGDRKSTRLNSSHRTISYAVFCLKKKKK